MSGKRYEKPSLLRRAVLVRSTASAGISCPPGEVLYEKNGSFYCDEPDA